MTVPGQDSRLIQWTTAMAAALAGAIFGLAAARALFELDPLRLGAFGAWPGALLAGGAGAAGVLALHRLTERQAGSWRWPFIALALPLFSLLASDVNLIRSFTLLLGALALAGLLWMAPLTEPANPEIRPGSGARHIRPYLLPLSLFLFLFLLYLRTLAPAVGEADTFEFQVGIARLGIAHGSGYPLLMLIGRLFTLLPLGGTLAFRANITSAFFGALAGVGVERLSRRLGASPVVAVLAGLTFGVSPTLWARAVEVEVYTLNATFVLAILYLALGFLDPADDSAPHTSSRLQLTSYQLRLCLLALVFGLSLTNHLTTLLLAPAVLAAVLMGFISKRQARVAPGARWTSSVLCHLPLAGFAGGSLFVVLSFLLGLSVYLYLPLRWPAINHGEALSLAGLLNILSGNEARGAFQWRLPFQDLGRYPIVWGKIVAEYGWAGLALAALGIFSRLRSPNPSMPVGAQAWVGRFGVMGTLGLAYAGYLYFALAFNVPDPDFSAFFIPLHLITVVLMGLGLQWLLNVILPGKRPMATTPGTARTILGSLFLTAVCLLPLSSIWRTFPAVDHSSNWAGQQAGELMLGQPLAEHAAILADSEKIAPLDYLQIAEGRRPDLDIVVLPDEASYRAALDERVAAGQVVYLGRYLPGLGAGYSLRSAGPLVEVSPTPFTFTSLRVQPALAQIANSDISLDGYATLEGETSLKGAAPGELNVSLVWQARSQPADNLLVNLRLVDGAGRVGWQSVGSVPISGLYPTNAWRAGEVLSDFYSLPVATSLAPGDYQLQVALLPPFATASDTAWTPVAPVSIWPPVRSPIPPHVLRDQIGPNWLLGYDLPEAVAPGAKFAVTLYWLRTNQSEVVPGPAAPDKVGDMQSIAAWPVGAVVPVQYQLTAPQTGSDFSLALGGGAPAICGWLAPTASACPLPLIKLAGQAAAEGAVNFDNQILLNQARLNATTVGPGGSVSLDLEWQALRAVAPDYTVFVHLLGPDGLVHGQIDRWPVSGTRATSGWAPGERIADPYVIQLPADAPAGDYQVEIGLYLLSTSERLSVLNAAGVPVDDRLLLRGLVVKPP